MHLSNSSLLCFLLGLAIVAATQTGIADTLLWDGDSNTSWDNTLNWTNSSGGADDKPEDNDTLEFSGSTPANQPLNNDIIDLIVDGLNFTNDNTAGQTATFTLDGNTLLLNGDITSTPLQSGTITNEIKNHLILQKDISVILPGANDGSTIPHNLILSGDISGAQKLIISDGSNLQFGTVTLSGNNTHSETVLNRKGRILVTSDTAVGTKLTSERETFVDLVDGVDLQASGGIHLENAQAARVFRLDQGGSTSASIAADFIVKTDGTVNNRRLQFETGDDDTLTISGVISSTNGNSRVQAIGTGTVIFTGNNTYVDATRINGGTIQIGEGGASGDIKSSLIEFNTNGGIGTLAINRNDTYTLAADINQTSGPTSSDAGRIRHLGSGTTILTGIVENNDTTLVESGTLQAGATTAFSQYSAYTIDAGATLRLAGFSNSVGSLSGAGVVENQDNAATPSTLTVGNDDTDTTFSGVIRDGTDGDDGALALTKEGNGTLTLSGSNSYTGATTVNTGTLDVTGSLTSSLTINSGAALNGEGQTNAGLSFASGGILKVDPSNGTAAFRVTGGVLNTGNSPGTVSVQWDGTAPASQFTVIDYNGATWNGVLSDFTTGSARDIFAQVGNTIALTAAAPQTQNWDNNGDGTGGDFLWNYSSKNWDNTTDYLFADRDNVTFGDTGVGTITITESVAPGSVTFTNTSGNDYSFTANTGTETISVTGGISISGDGNVTFNNVIAGDTSITKSGSGTLILGNSNTFTGVITVNEGTVAGNNTSLSMGDPSRAHALTVNTGGVFDVSRVSNISNYQNSSFHINGGSVIHNGTVVRSIDNRLKLTGDLIVGGSSSRIDLRDLNITGTDVSITKVGTNEVRLEVDNSAYAELNEIFIDGGTLTYAGTNAFGDNNATVEVRPSGTLSIQGDLTLANEVTLEGGRIEQRTSGSTGVLSGPLNVEASGGALDPDNTASFLSVTGTLSGVGPLATGNGTVTISGGSNAGFTGSVSVGSNSHGSGTLRLVNPTETNILSGASSIEIQLNSVLDVSGITAGFVVPSGQTIGGIGTVTGNATFASGSFVSPGRSPGVLTFTDDLTLSSGSTIIWELIANSESNRGTDFDGIDMTNSGLLTIDSGAVFRIDATSMGGADDVLWSNEFWDLDRSWKVFDLADGSASLGDSTNIFVLESMTPLDSASNSLDTANRGFFGFEEITAPGSEGIYLTFTAVPEPSSFAIMGFGLASFGWLIRRRKKATRGEK